ncbi:MAG: MerR family transcriptional regulator [Nitrospirota bacterium]|jgi:MerR family transcriptional regulator/heat shock protein HspR
MITRDKDRPMYMISVVARMLSVHPQTLRLYEREGFVRPHRQGGQRLYSETDVERLSLILELTRTLGVNKAGVDIILRMRRRLEMLQREVEHMLQGMEESTRSRFEYKLREILLEEERNNENG